MIRKTLVILENCFWKFCLCLTLKRPIHSKIEFDTSKKSKCSFTLLNQNGGAFPRSECSIRKSGMYQTLLSLLSIYIYFFYDTLRIIIKINMYNILKSIKFFKCFLGS